MPPDEPMACLYRAPDTAEATLLLHALEADGIPAERVGGSLSNTFGELGADALQVEVWVPKNRLADGRKCIDAYYARRTEPGEPTTSIAPWTCPGCSEENDAGFELCWSCQTERPAG
jgi:hypothetical protein